MNCPVCGAEVGARDRFCAECGTPLENQVDNQATVAGQLVIDEDQDRTMPPAGPSRPERARTVMMTADDIRANVQPPPTAQTDFEVDSTVEVPYGSDMPYAADDEGSFVDDDSRNTTQRNLIIAGVVVFILLLLCCCCALMIGAILGSDPVLMEEIMRELSL